MKKAADNAQGYTWESYFYKIKEIIIKDKITFDSNTSLAHLFYFFTKLNEIEGLDNLDTSNVTDMSRMFGNCSSFSE